MTATLAITPLTHCRRAMPPRSRRGDALLRFLEEATTFDVKQNPPLNAV